jgi:serine/threonine protein kinase
MDRTTWARAKDLIGEALALPAGERDAFIAARCPDPALRAEIQALLRHYALEQTTTGEDLGQPDEFEPGTRVGPYVIVDRLGRGGMGEVFLANDRRLRRKVALKHLLPSRLGHADERARILREARAAASISHPNVATIHDVVEQDDRIYIVMEYVEGETLTARLRRDRLSAALVASIGRQLASALAAAHARGVIHRDLKPGNIQIARDGTVKVLDFGIAKAIPPVASSASTSPYTAAIEVPGAQPGTPPYMSPEQLRGAANVDARSDIFSLGLVLFEMATGRRPFPGKDPLERLAAFARPAERADVVTPSVPKPLADVIARALVVDVNGRTQHATEVEVALAQVEQVFDKAAASFRLHEPGRRARVTWASRLAFAAAAASGLVVLFGLFGALATQAFNLALQRPERFATEPLFRYVVFGGQSVFVLIVFALALAAVKGAVTFLFRVLNILPPIARLIKRGRRFFAPVSEWIALDDPDVFGQVLATAGVVAFALVIWWHLPVISAYLQWLPLAPAERLVPLSPEGTYARGSLRRSVNLLLVLIGLGGLRLARLQAARPSSGRIARLGIVGSLFAIVLLFHVLPYRILYQNRFERVDVGGSRCYLVSMREPEAFVFCPEARPPRSRVIRIDDPAVRRLGIFESMFTPPFEP